MPPEVLRHNDAIDPKLDQNSPVPNFGNNNSNDDFWAATSNRAAEDMSLTLTALTITYDYDMQTIAPAGDRSFSDLFADRRLGLGSDGYNPYNTSVMDKANDLTKFVASGGDLSPDPNDSMIDWAEKILTKGIWDSLSKDEQKAIKDELDALEKYRIKQMLSDTQPSELVKPDTDALDAFNKRIADAIRPLEVQRDQRDQRDHEDPFRPRAYRPQGVLRDTSGRIIPSVAYE